MLFAGETRNSEVFKNKKQENKSKILSLCKKIFATKIFATKPRKEY